MSLTEEEKMAKAMLIMDMPRACYVCPFCYKAELIAKGNYLYEQLHRCRMEPLDVEDVYLDDVVYKKPTWCPLREVPQKKQGGDYTSLIIIGERKGYNACIDEILGGGE